MRGVKDSKPRNKKGRPPHKPDDKNRQMVEMLSGFGIPEKKIALALKISLPTLLIHYANEIAEGAATVEARLVGNLLRLAGGDDGTALKATMFSLQTRFGWSQYAPEIVNPRPKPLGKKEEAEIASHTAHEESDWGHLVH